MSGLPEGIFNGSFVSFSNASHNNKRRHVELYRWGYQTSLQHGEIRDKQWIAPVFKKQHDKTQIIRNMFNKLMDCIELQHGNIL